MKKASACVLGWMPLKNVKSLEQGTAVRAPGKGSRASGARGVWWKCLSVGALSEVILSSHPIALPLLLLTSTKTWEQCGERNLKALPPPQFHELSPRTLWEAVTLVSIVEGRVSWRPLGNPNFLFLPGFPPTNTGVRSGGAGSAGVAWPYQFVYLWLQTYCRGVIQETPVNSRLHNVSPCLSTVKAWGKHLATD